MTKAKFEQFKAEKESALYQCLRGRLGEEDIPDMPSIDSLREQFHWFKLGVDTPPEKDDIDWHGLEKELKACADEVVEEWHERKQAENRREAIRAGRS